MRPGRMSFKEKPKNVKSTLKKLTYYMKRLAPLFIFSLVLIIIGTLFELIGPNKLKLITNEISAGLPGKDKLVKGIINTTLINKLMIQLVIIYSLAFLFDIFENVILAKITTNTTKDLRVDIIDKINKVPLKYFDKSSIGEILSTVTNDVDSLGQSLNQSISSLVTSIIKIVGAFMMMLYNSPKLTLYATTSSMVGFVVMRFIIKISQKNFALRQKHLAEVNGYIEEMYTNQSIVKSYNAKEEVIKNFDKYNNNLKTTAFTSQFLSMLMMPIMNFVSNLSYVVVSIVGSILVIRGEIEFGVIVAFLMYIRLFTQPFNQLAQSINNLQGGLASAERIFNFLDEEEDIDENIETLNNVNGRITFENVNFSYNEDKKIIDNFNLRVKQGQKIAIVGKTGSGKTTLVNLLMRFYDIDSGDILIDDKSIYDYSKKEIQKHIGMVLQTTWLFEGSIKDNIIFNTPNATLKDVIAVSKTIGLDHYIKSLPNGYDTIISEKTNFSEGQKQLITIARVMLQNSPILILDEATSSVDTRTERIVQEAMDRLALGRTSFVIAHRLSTIKNSDVIILIDEGKIIEKGNHQQLLKLKGDYYKLYNSQFE